MSKIDAETIKKWDEEMFGKEAMQDYYKLKKMLDLPENERPPEFFKIKALLSEA